MLTGARSRLKQALTREWAAGRRVRSVRMEDLPTAGEAPVPAGCIRDWVVLLEAAADDEASYVDIGTVHAILKVMGDEAGVGLHCPDRIGVQVRGGGVDPAKALSAVMARWECAAVTLVPAGWQVVRAEVLTLNEFVLDCQAR